MKQLNNANIVKFIDYLESKDNCYLVMEYCNGGDLECIMKNISLLFYSTFINQKEFKRKRGTFAFLRNFEWLLSLFYLFKLFILVLVKT